jgi:signal transduction histidine kinase
LPRLSLRTWILLPAWALVTGLIFVLSASQADTLITAWLRSSSDIAELAGQQVKETLLRRLQESTPSTSRSAIDARTRWASFIRTDAGIESVVAGIVGRGGAIVEISIADQAGRVLISSNRARTGQLAKRAEPLNSLGKLSTWERFRRVFAAAQDYGSTVSIGIEGEQTPLFTIHVLVSNVLLRDALGPGLQRIAVIAAAALVLSWVLVYAVAAFTTSNLKRIGTMIDRIAGSEAEPGRTGSVSAGEFPAEEFAAVSSKLSLLDTRVRGALDDAEQYKNRVTAMLESLEEAILLFDDDRLVLAAGPVAALLGISPDQVVNRKRREVLLAGTALGEAIDAAYSAGRNVHDQQVTTIIGGHERRLKVNLDFISAPGSPRPAALLRLRDAEGAGSVESQLKLSARLEAINRLTGGVAHEIKNPLNAISARLSLLESIVADESPEAEEQIRTISDEIERLDRVVRTFLDFTRPLEIARDQFDLAALGREVANDLSPDAARRGITVTFEEFSDSPLVIYGDRDLLKQAILNIAVNGLEAMEKSGNLRFYAEEHSGMARLSISDTGPGIPESQLAEIFKLYFTTKKNGSGIGLAVCYRTLQLHGGELSVESTNGIGSTFHLTVPLSRMEDFVEQSGRHGLAAGVSTNV